MPDPLITIAKDASATMVIKKSRFIASLHRISSESEAQTFIKQVATDNRKATHNCFAYQCGTHNEIQRESDNGEPSGTAGVPILKALQMEKVHNTVAVVTRYFGGIKLGAGGLIRAYSNVTTAGIHEAGLVQCIPQRVVVITCPYNLHGSLTNWLGDHHLRIAAEDYAVNVTVTIMVDDAAVDQVMADLTDRFNDQLKLAKKGQQTNEVPLEPKANQ